ncbi:MAG TPA: hybrid sensor histidine kinase/response regulator [Candidatus Sulfomarinibacteraceae bacterium]|nr:hybrid sensor histidine kinase/response regulator [Candidatus Sulfomarinibacteraceae bacterium]
MSDKTRVLYIEDDVGSQRLVQRVLENHDCEVLIADEGLQGIDLARQSQPNLILMDINLPGMNGREITSRLRGLPNFSSVPIVALTANNNPGHRERALAAGCDGFLTKPIDVVSFPNEVHHFLEGYRERLDNEEKLTHLELHTHEMVARLENKIQELERVNRRLRELDEMKNDFIALVSHELRTPLTLLEGYTHLLHDRVSGSPETYSQDMVRLVDGLNVGVGRISQVINEVINVTRITSGTLQLSLGPVRLGDLTSRVVEEFRQTIAERQLTLTVGDFSHLPVIQADGKQLSIALKNILSNAVKYTPDGGRVTVEAHLMDDAIDITVSDTGIGIPVDEQRHIFEQFYVLESIDHHSTSKSAFQGGGLGLGLAIAQGIIEAHDGRVWVESEGHDPRNCPGSTFHLLLPLTQKSQNVDEETA